MRRTTCLTPGTSDTARTPVTERARPTCPPRRGAARPRAERPRARWRFATPPAASRSRAVHRATGSPPVAGARRGALDAPAGPRLAAAALQPAPAAGRTAGPATARRAPRDRRPADRRARSGIVVVRAGARLWDRRTGILPESRREECDVVFPHCAERLRGIARGRRARDGEDRTGPCAGRACAAHGTRRRPARGTRRPSDGDTPSTAPGRPSAGRRHPSGTGGGAPCRPPSPRCPYHPSITLLRPHDSDRPETV